MDNRVSILKLSEVESKELIPRTEARFVHSENMTLAYWKFESGATLPEHAHPHEQMTNVVDGVLELIERRGPGTPIRTVVPFDEPGVITKAARTGRSILLQDVREDPDYFRPGPRHCPN